MNAYIALIDTTENTHTGTLLYDDAIMNVPTNEHREALFQWRMQVHDAVSETRWTTEFAHMTTGPYLLLTRTLTLRHGRPEPVLTLTGMYWQNTGTAQTLYVSLLADVTSTLQEDEIETDLVPLILPGSLMNIAQRGPEHDLDALTNR